MIFLELKKSIARFPSKIFFAKKGLAHYFLPIWLMEMLIINGFFFFFAFLFFVHFFACFFIAFLPQTRFNFRPCFFFIATLKFELLLHVKCSFVCLFVCFQGV